MPKLKGACGQLDIQVDYAADTVTFVLAGTTVGSLSGVPVSACLFACFGGSSQYVTVCSAGGSKFGGAFYCGPKLKREAQLAAGEVHTFEVLWDGTHGQAHCWAGQAALTGPYDGSRLSCDGSGSATYLGCTEIGPNKSVVKEVKTGVRLTVGDEVVLAGPCSKSGLAQGEVGVICKDDHDSRPYKVTCLAGTSDYYTEAEIVAAPSPDAGIVFGHVAMYNSGEKNCSVSLSSLRLGVFPEPTNAVPLAEASAADPDAAHMSFPAGASKRLFSSASNERPPVASLAPALFDASPARKHRRGVAALPPHTRISTHAFALTF